MAAVRVFVSLPLLPELAGRVAKLAGKLRSAQPPGLKWAGPETWHFTLAFLGYLDEDGLAKAEQACEATAGRHQAFWFSLGPLGIFSFRGQGRVLWLGLSRGQTEMADVQQDLAAELRARGFALEERPFVPHLTLARAKPGAEVGRQALQTDTSCLAACRQLASRIEVMRSDLSPEGPRYTVLAAYPLMDQQGSCRGGSSPAQETPGLPDECEAPAAPRKFRDKGISPPAMQKTHGGKRSPGHARGTP